MKILRALVVVSAFAPLLGCASGPPFIVDGFKMDRHYYEFQRAGLLRRAAFDLNCPAEKLQTTILQVAGGGAAYQMGVTGCEQRLTYIAPREDNTWILNAASGQPVAEQAPPK